MSMSDLPVMTRTRIFLLLLMDQPTTFHVNSAGFGYSVVQYANWVVVGAPQEIKAADQTGGLYQCDYSMGKCEPILLPGESLPPAETQAQRIPAALQECPRQEQDIAFLIDGSGSISATNFAKMLNFVKAMMRQFQRPSSQFSLVQFSHKFQVHFTFKAFAASSNPLSLLNSVQKLSGYTYTATAIRRVTEQLFSALYGARKDASKILIVITDGQKEGDPLDYKDVIPSAEAAGIIRYAIGVGLAFQNIHSWQELKDIASKPSHEHIFKVENFDALRDIQNQLKEKIFAIEGTQTISSSSFELEMSQEGFSAVFMPDGPVLGAVGSFSWSGGAFLYPPNRSPTFINMSQEHADMRDSYLGYSTELAVWKGVHSLVLGAPRHQHTGKVVIFTQVSGQWRPKAEVTGTQIGSYFGASLSSVDVDRDGSSDLVLIGAPHYYEQSRGGQVSVCPFPRGRAKWQCGAVLRGEQGHLWARFGAALTVLGDVNGDRLTDVAIGAPGEQENRGAVYLFHGTLGLGISPAHSQRITGAQFSPSLQYFGQSLSGGQDLTMDGLVDLAVGAWGHALLLRTRPVLRVWANIRITPPEITRSVYECHQQLAFAQSLGEAIVCLRVSQSPKNRLANLQSIVTFDLTLDPGRLSPRAVFEETRTRNLTRVRDLGLTQHCEPVRLLLPACVEDSVTPIILRLNFSLVGKPVSGFGNLQPMLAVDAQRYFMTSLPFEKNCGADHVCQDDLGISFGVSGLKTLIVGSNLELNLEVRVWNDGEDSYGTTITFFYPLGLSYRRVAGGQVLSSLGKERLMAGDQQRLLCWVNNLGQRDLPVSIDFSVPVKLNQLAVWKDVDVLHPQNPSIQCSSERTVPTESDFLTHFQKKPVLDCSIADCLRFRCDIRSFGVQEELDFILKGNLSFGWVSQTLQKKVLVVSVAEITFNRSVYSQLPGQEAFLRAQMELVLEKYEVYNPTPIIVGSSVGGLLLLALITAILYKVGFFKRQYKEMMEGANGQTAPENGTGDPQVAQ
ncbi:hypothetical protein E2I00_002548 [Balaenoptera physalus]|uniref:VWFA domain-containing protein n=1 Tax=Balaenoptera physalus TaxID=9770 RepID=A0A643BKA5_BALPH|nr:hypothetical protein E2I00_002548 [Balaenoptera physalus]